MLDQLSSCLSMLIKQGLEWGLRGIPRAPIGRFRRIQAWGRERVSLRRPRGSPAVKKKEPLRKSSPGKVQSSPVLSVVDGNSLFAVQNGSLTRYPWCSSKGAYKDSDVKKQAIGSSLGGYVRSTLLVDGADSIYTLTTFVAQGDGQMFYFSSYDSDGKDRGGEKVDSSPSLLFTTDGTLIGYDSQKVYDLSPRRSSPKRVNTFANKTIYSAFSVTVAPDAAEQLKDGDQVILKGRDIRLPKAFRWPRGKMLKVQTVAQGP